MPPPHATRPSEAMRAKAARSTWHDGAMALLAEARGKAAGLDSLLQLRVVRVQAQRALEQDVLDLFMVGIRQAALHGAHRLTSLVIVEADTLRAKLGIDHVDRV